MNAPNNPSSLQLSKVQQQCLALAAIVQSAELVHQLAHRGDANPYQAKPLLHSLFVFDPKSTIEIYGDLRFLEQGFNRLYQLLDGNIENKDKHILQYAMGILHLSDRTRSRNDILNVLRQRLSAIQVGEDAWLSTPAQINQIYKDTISKLGKNIQIQGDRSHLQNDLTAARIRTLLLAGIRGGILWRQLGGSKLHFMFQRSNLKKTVRELAPIN